ncbi:TetR family transcriptional regulator [Arthrobacter glacialis]|uniref:TetR/AcrR family transcriptional regulator n=1 Tax=Arthrobacter glacialis TaxID=1664 RepID=A0A2S4A030_ARTGL|nr:TetR family transcriptional regulator [Arthrobacter glacialis]POH74522.1 TetR/AcrR family transcriptional regulator [Arthrobacter glacialis]
MPTKAKVNLGPSAGPANRAALIAAARDVFAEAGFMAPLSSVARRASVGQGSLYRHFPDRIALAVAVFDDNITALEELGARTDSTLVDLFDSVAEQVIASTALIDMILSERNDQRAEHLATRMTAVAAALLARDQDQGRLALHVEPADIMLAISMLAMLLARTPDGERTEAATRARAIFRAAFVPVQPVQPPHPPKK